MCDNRNHNVGSCISIPDIEIRYNARDNLSSVCLSVCVYVVSIHKILFKRSYS